MCTECKTSMINVYGLCRCSTGADWSVTMSFLRVGTNVYMVGYSFQACRQESVQYQTCLIFLRPFPTLVTDPDFIHLATGLSVNLTACRLHFPPCPLMKQACLYQVFGLFQIWSSRPYLKTKRLCGRNNRNRQ